MSNRRTECAEEPEAGSDEEPRSPRVHGLRGIASAAGAVYRILMAPHIGPGDWSLLAELLHEAAAARTAPRETLIRVGERFPQLAEDLERLLCSEPAPRAVDIIALLSMWVHWFLLHPSPRQTLPVHALHESPLPANPSRGIRDEGVPTPTSEHGERDVHS